MKTALIIGATGLVGRKLVQLLLNDSRYERVRVFVRRKMGFVHPKMEEYIVDFNSLSKWQHLLKGDELFAAMGTTAKDAGSKEKQYLADFTYPFEIAKIAEQNGVHSLFHISSYGANPKSIFFYSKIKGQLEDEIIKLNFRKIVIFQPSLLVGDREKPRNNEIIAEKWMMLIIKYIPSLRKYQPIKAENVAKAMVNAANSGSTIRLEKFSLQQIFDMAQ